MSIFNWLSNARRRHALHDKLWDAMYRNDLESIEQFVREGADLKAFCASNELDPPLVNVARTGNLPMIKLLVELGADINQKGEGNATPLMGAVYNAYLDVIQYLLKHGANPLAQNSEGDSVLDIARSGRIEDKRSEVVNILEKYI